MPIRAVVKVDRKPACSGPPMESSFLEEGSPTMVEKGMDPASVFEMCDDDDDNGIHDVKDSAGGGAEGINAAAGTNAAAAAAAAPLPSGSESSTSLRHRRRGRSVERAEPKSKRESWMDPPEERESTTLTQAEMESCMQSYSVRGNLYLLIHKCSIMMNDHIQTVFSLVELWFYRSTLSLLGHLPGLPRDVCPVRLRGALLVGLSPGCHVCSHQQHH